MADGEPNESVTRESRHFWILAWLAGAVAMFFVLSGGALLPGVDTYYHLKMARLMPQLGFIHEFPWLHWTIFRDHFVSHHYGFHAILSPFVWVSDRLTGDLVMGGKVAVIAAMGTSAAVFYGLLRSLRIPQALFWTLLLGCLPWHFWLRMAYVRAPIVALPLLLLAVLVFLKERRVLVWLVACLFTSVYLGAVVAILVPFCLSAGHIIARTTTRRTWMLLALFLAGLACGLVFSPYFPENLPFLRIQIFATGLGAEKDVPSEWRPFDAWTLATMSAPLAAIWFGALILRLRRGEAMGARSLGLLLLNLSFLALTLKARRFIEYWPVFALLNAADMARFTAADVCQFVSGSREWTRRAAVLLPMAAVFMAMPGLFLVRSHARPGTNHAAIRPAMAYLAGHSEEGSLVFTDDWDVFPSCFYYNTHNRYMVGLDPMFTMSRYPELWERYRLITRGRTPTQMGPPFNILARKPVKLDDIGDIFMARYVLLMEEDSDLHRQLLSRSDRFKLIYPEGPDVASGEQPAVVIFEVLPRRPSGAAASGS